MQCLIKNIQLVDYEPTWQSMLNFTKNRDSSTKDEIWILEHYPVFTQGKAGKAEHLFQAGNIPVVQSDRGGQITYHAPGQLVIYLLLDLARLNIGIKMLVSIIEQSLIEYLDNNGVKANLREKSPGVYVKNNKIASLGLRVSRGCSMHGLSLNVAMDLQPFSQIRPCGLVDVGVCQLSEFVPTITLDEVANSLSLILLNKLGYSN